MSQGLVAIKKQDANILDDVKPEGMDANLYATPIVSVTFSTWCHTKEGK